MARQQRHGRRAAVVRLEGAEREHCQADVLLADAVADDHLLARLVDHGSRVLIPAALRRALEPRAAATVVDVRAFHAMPHREVPVEGDSIRRQAQGDRIAPAVGALIPD